MNPNQTKEELLNRLRNELWVKCSRQIKDERSKKWSKRYYIMAIVAVVSIAVSYCLNVQIKYVEPYPVHIAYANLIGLSILAIVLFVVLASSRTSPSDQEVIALCKEQATQFLIIQEEKIDEELWEFQHGKVQALTNEKALLQKIRKEGIKIY